ncbi:hypothetical protein [Larkinella harenae]
MNDLFDTNGNFRPDNAILQHALNTTVRTRRNHLSGVISEMDPDMLWWLKSGTATKSCRFFRYQSWQI